MIFQHVAFEEKALTDKHYQKAIDDCAESQDMGPYITFLLEKIDEAIGETMMMVTGFEGRKSPCVKKLLQIMRAGQEYSSKSLNLPAFSLSAVWHTQERDEWVVSLGISRARYNVTQYSRFGWDPQGNPRYNLNEGVTIGPVSTPVVPTLNVLYRLFWNSNPSFTFYSAFGGGLIYTGTGESALIPLPALTPVGMRAGWKHLYFYLETGLTPLSSLVHGGLGWRF
jgi:hypothetical protein